MICSSIHPLLKKLKRVRTKHQSQISWQVDCMRYFNSYSMKSCKMSLPIVKYVSLCTPCNWSFLFRFRFFAASTFNDRTCKIIRKIIYVRIYWLIDGYPMRLADFQTKPSLSMNLRKVISLTYPIRKRPMLDWHNLLRTTTWAEWVLKWRKRFWNGIKLWNRSSTCLTFERRSLPIVVRMCIFCGIVV